jgi:hypothetical protein
MRFSLPRHLVPATLAVAILIAPLPASAVPAREALAPSATFESVVAWVGGLLRHLWAEEGGSLDPLGRPAPAPAATTDDGRQ